MIVVVILVASTCLFRALGVAGVELFATWQAATRAGLSVMLLFTAAAHFNRMRGELVAMVPPAFPRPDLAVSVTGGLEALAAIGLWIPQTRVAAGLGLILMLLAMLPANISAARRGLRLGGQPVTPIAVRVPMQAVFIALVWWVALAPGAAA